MSVHSESYEKHMNLKIAANELGIPWQSLYAKLRVDGVRVIGDKLRYGSDRDKLSAMAESKFSSLVKNATPMNEIRFQSKYDFDVMGYKVDVKASLPHKLSKKYDAKSWAFSFKKQTLICDFVVCFCFDESKDIKHVLLVPSEFFRGLSTISVSCNGSSKWLDYSVPANDLEQFFKTMALI